MRLSRALIVPALLFSLAACVTTEQAQQAVSARFIGQSSDAFFRTNGAPYSSYPLTDGGTLYRWRGGETSIHVPAQYQTIGTPPAAGTTNTRTTTQVSRPDANTTVTETQTTSSSFSVGAPSQVMVTPARTIQVFCDAQIAVNAEGTITSVQILQDTVGAGLSFSRCAEIFGVK